MAKHETHTCDLCGTMIGHEDKRFTAGVILNRIEKRGAKPVMIETLDVCVVCAPKLVEKLRP